MQISSSYAPESQESVPLFVPPQGTALSWWSPVNYGLKMIIMCADLS